MGEYEEESADPVQRVPDADTQRAAVAALLARRPHASVAAVDESGLFVTMPPGVPLDGHPIVHARSGLDVVVAADRHAVIDAWQAARAHGLARCSVHLDTKDHELVSLHLLDARAAYGTHFAFFLGAVPLGIEPSDEPPPRMSRVVRVRKDSLGCITHADRFFTDLLGWEPEQVVGRRTLDLVHPDDQEVAVEQWMWMLARPGALSQVRLRHLAADGTYMWMDVHNHNLLDDPTHGYVAADMVDISEEVAAKDAFHDRESKLLQLSEALPIGLALVDRAGEVLYANKRLGELAGLGGGGRFDSLIAQLVEDDRPRLREAMAGVLAERRVIDLEVRLRPSPGASLRYLALSLLSVFDDDGGIRDRAAAGAIVCVTDTTEGARLRLELERRATFDHLTGCANRASVIATLEEVLARPGAATAVLYVDLDGFKAVNDTLGHAVGDELLMIAARRLRDVVGTVGTIGRVGGDEFLVVCPEVTDVDLPMTLADQIATRLAEPIVIDGVRVSARASLGVATSPNSGVDAEQLVARADTAMYRSKRNGRGRPVAFDVTVLGRPATRVSGVPSLREARAAGELEVHVQPVVDLATRSVFGFEALLRWRRGDRLVPAREFMELAEATGLIVDLGEWVFEELGRQAAAFPAARADRLRWFVNVSAPELARPDLASRLVAGLRGSPIDPHALVVEVTEHTRLVDDPLVAGNLADLRELGVQLALDDFGTGWSSLELLRRLPVGWLKLDRGFGADVDGDPRAAVLVRSLLALAADLGLSTVIEGVEREAQHDALLACGASLAQGFLYAAPAPAGTFAADGS